MSIIRNSFKLSCTAVALATTLASVPAFATPTVTLYGGGATLPANAYVGGEWLQYTPPHRLSNTDPLNPNGSNPKSIFGILQNHATYPSYVQYCQTGSTVGRQVITGAKPDATSACGDYSGPTPNGFSATTARANFGASDAPLSSSDVSTFMTNNGAVHGSPVQFPAVGGAIAVIYNNADQTTRLNLTESQICQIFAGQITNWNKIIKTLPSKPIKLVVRSDGSGTTYSWMNHLSAVCPTAHPKTVSGFTTQSVYATGAVGGVLPAGTLAVSGNGNVVTTVAATDGAIGYAEASDTKTRQDVSGITTLNWATVQKRSNQKAVYDEFGNIVTPAVTYKKFDPFLNSPQSFKVAITSDKVITGNDANGRPVLGPVTPGAGAEGCIQLVDPNTYAIPSLTAKGDYTRYPITAISYLLAYYKKNETGKVKYIETLLQAPYISSNRVAGVVDTVGAGTGFSWLNFDPLDATASARISASKPKSMVELVPTCINF